LGIILIALVGLTMFIPHHIAITPWIALSSIIFIFVYLISIRIIYYNEQNHPENNQHHNTPDNLPSTKTIIKNYILFSSLIVVAALALPFFAEHIAEMTSSWQFQLPFQKLQYPSPQSEWDQSIWQSATSWAATYSIYSFLQSTIYSIQRDCYCKTPLHHT
jgi:Ca2+/Na+ antiporter